MNSAASPNTEQTELQISEDGALVTEYISQVWNQNRLAELSVYLDDHFIDHSMPYTSVQNKEGHLMYLRELARNISHTTEILGLTTVGELVICQIRISVSVLSGRDEINGDTELIDGYRVFRMCENKIVEHWEIF